MKKILFFTMLCVFLVSCGNTADTEMTITKNETPTAQESGGDNRVFTCLTIAAETQEKLQKANTNPDIVLEFIETETILGDVSSCFMKVKITNPNDDSVADNYVLFDVVRERTRSQFASLEELEAEVAKIVEETKNNSQ